MVLQVPAVTVVSRLHHLHHETLIAQDDLYAYHAKHFPHAPTPDHVLHGVEQDVVEEYEEEEDDGLGYYPDGTKRTLTDEQIAMFRHSEIQSILRSRRLRQEGGEFSEEGEAASESPLSAATPVPAPMERVQSSRVEKQRTQQWTTSSARTKAKNKKNRDKYRAKNKEARLKKERAQQEGRPEQAEDEESDEWDPWHQANGPDVQKDETVDLNY